MEQFPPKPPRKCSCHDPSAWPGWLDGCKIAKKQVQLCTCTAWALAAGLGGDRGQSCAPQQQRCKTPLVGGHQTPPLLLLALLGGRDEVHQVFSAAGALNKQEKKLFS